MSDLAEALHAIERAGRRSADALAALRTAADNARSSTPEQQEPQP